MTSFRKGVVGGFLIAAQAVLLSSPVTSPAQAQTPSEWCDWLAAAPIDRTKPPGVRGVNRNEIDLPNARLFCMQAVTLQPDNARMHYQLGRVLHVAKEGQEALYYYRRAAEMGHALAKHNMGALLLGEAGVPANRPAAVRWFEAAVNDGVELSKSELAKMLDSGEGLPSADPSRAAFLWRSLADKGDPEASEQVGLALVSGRVTPLEPNEAVQRLTAAADKGRPVATLALARHLSERARSAEDANSAARQAYKAHQFFVGSPPNSEAGWLPYQLETARLLMKSVTAGARNPAPPGEYQAILRTFSEKAKKVTVPMRCGEAESKFDLFVWEWDRSYPQTDSQIEWLRQVRGCTVAPEIAKAFRDVYAIARQNNMNFPELLAYALTQAPQASAASPPAPAASTRSPVPSANAAPPPASTGPTLSNTDVAIGAGAAALAAGCLYFERCRNAMGEVATNTAKDAATILGVEALTGRRR